MLKLTPDVWAAGKGLPRVCQGSARVWSVMLVTASQGPHLPMRRVHDGHGEGRPAGSHGPYSPCSGMAAMQPSCRRRAMTGGGAGDGAGQLLDSIGGHVNPLQLVQQIPQGMAIPDLRDRLVRPPQYKPGYHTIARFTSCSMQHWWKVRSRNGWASRSSAPMWSASVTGDTLSLCIATALVC